MVTKNYWSKAGNKKNLIYWPVATNSTFIILSFNYVNIKQTTMMYKARHLTYGIPGFYERFSFIIAYSLLI